MGTFNDQLNAFKSEFAQTKTDFANKLDEQEQEIGGLTKQVSSAATSMSAGTQEELTSPDVKNSLQFGDTTNTVKDDIDNQDKPNGGMQSSQDTTDYDPNEYPTIAPAE